jgi:RecA-family ATPase
MASGSGLSGSTAWNNAVRSRLYLAHPMGDNDAEPDEDARVLSRMKANYARAHDAMDLIYRDGGFACRHGETGMVGAILHRATDALFLRLLDATTAEGRSVSESPNACNYAPRAFARRPDREGRTRQDFVHSMERLFATGAIRVESYGAPSARTRRIVRASSPAAGRSHVA